MRRASSSCWPYDERLFQSLMKRRRSQTTFEDQPALNPAPGERGVPHQPPLLNSDSRIRPERNPFSFSWGRGLGWGRANYPFPVRLWPQPLRGNCPSVSSQPQTSTHIETMSRTIIPDITKSRRGIPGRGFMTGNGKTSYPHRHHTSRQTRQEPQRIRRSQHARRSGRR